VIVADVEAFEVLAAARRDVGHELLWGDAGLFGGDHDGGAMGIVRAHELDLVALHALEAHPDVSLDVLHDVADVKGAVGIGQGSGDEEFARHDAEGRIDRRNGNGQ
jgi:hypothetical protein